MDNVTLDSQSRATSRHTTEEPNSTLATFTKIRALFIGDEKCVVLHDSEEIIRESDVINAVQDDNLKMKVYSPRHSSFKPKLTSSVWSPRP